MRRSLLLALPFALACSSEEEMPPPMLAYPTVPGTKSLVVITEQGARPLEARAYDLTKAHPALEVRGLAILRALYYTEDLATLEMKEGPLVLTDENDTFGKRLPIFEKAQEISITGGADQWTEITEVDPLYFRYREKAILRGTLRRWVTVDPIPLVQVCVRNSSTQPCVETNAAGMFEIDGFEPNEEAVITFERPDLLSTASMLLFTEPEYLLPFFMMGQTELDAVNTMVGATPDLVSRGIVDFVAFRGISSTVNDVVGELSPPSGMAHGHDEGGILYDVDPGRYRLLLSHPTRRFCGPTGNGANWPGMDTNEVEVEVYAGFITHVQGLTCFD